MQGHRSVKADVYSFGVLLLELLSGRKNLDLNLSHETQSLLAWVRSTVSNIFRTIQTMFFSSIYKLFSEVWNLRVMPFADLLFDTNIVITYIYLLRFAFEDKSEGWSLIQEYGFLHFEIWDNLNCLSLMSSRFHLWNWRWQTWKCGWCGDFNLITHDLCLWCFSSQYQYSNLMRALYCNPYLLLSFPLRFRQSWNDWRM